MILETFPLGPAETNAYLLGCSETKRAAVIDAPLHSAKEIEKSAHRLGLRIDMLLLTHSHWDHIVDAALFKEKWGIPIYIHSEDAENLRHPGSDRLPMIFSVTGVEPDGLLQDAQIVSVGNLTLEVIHTPGHTPGGVCFYLAEQQTLFSGDTLFHRAIGNLSFPTAQPQLMWKSLKRLARLPPHTKVYPGHGGSTTIGQESWITNAEERFE
jgi:hydroxyacylglutathione hydrolase